MKILLICSLFPPDAKGGAELSAYNAAQFLLSQGHDVAVLTTARSKQTELNGERVNGLRIWRKLWPRPYAMIDHDKARQWQKVLWHLQDHIDPRNKTIVQRVVQEFQPNAINIHLIQGIGHNTIPTLAGPGRTPIFYFLHDLALTCIRGSMYHQRNCSRQCLACKASSALKMSSLSTAAELHFISPSRDNWNTINNILPLNGRRCTILPNLDFDTPIRSTRAGGQKLVRLLYVGRVHKTKGIDFLINVLEQIPSTKDKFALTVVGGGPQEDELRARYQHDWVEFTGRVAPERVKEYLAQADLLCAPSLWRENHPGVVRQALRAGVPAFVSDMGGTKEMVENGKSGMVLPAACGHGWRSALERAAYEPDFLRRLQEGAFDCGQKYSARSLGMELQALMMSSLRTLNPKENSLLSTESSRRHPAKSWKSGEDGRSFPSMGSKQ